MSDTRELADAVNDGQKFLAREHPDAKVDLADMLSQMQSTVVGLASVTSVVTGFRFTNKGSDVDREPARFNEYVIEQKKSVAALRGGIRSLKGSCEKIRNDRDTLNELAGDKNDWTAMFRLFGKQRREREIELAAKLSDFYADDQRIIEVITQIMSISEAALAEADEALGPAGTASPDRVGLAASVLNVYAQVFKQSEKRLAALVKTLERAAVALG